MHCIILGLRTNNNINIIFVGWAEFAVSVVRGDRPLAALEVQPLVEAGPRRCVVGLSALAILSDTAVISLHVAIHFVLVLFRC